MSRDLLKRGDLSVAAFGNSKRAGRWRRLGLRVSGVAEAIVNEHYFFYFSPCVVAQARRGRPWALPIGERMLARVLTVMQEKSTYLVLRSTPAPHVAPHSQWNLCLPPLLMWAHHHLHCALSYSEDCASILEILACFYWSFNSHKWPPWCDLFLQLQHSPREIHHGVMQRIDCINFAF